MAQPAPVHLSVHHSWLNQIELYFSIVQRKVLAPNDFSALEELAERLSAFARGYREIDGLKQTGTKETSRITSRVQERGVRELLLNRVGLRLGDRRPGEASPLDRRAQR